MCCCCCWCGNWIDGVFTLILSQTEAVLALRGSRVLTYDFQSVAGSFLESIHNCVTVAATISTGQVIVIMNVVGIIFFIKSKKLKKIFKYKQTIQIFGFFKKFFILFSTTFVYRLTMISLTVSTKKKSNDFNICFWLNTVSERGGVLLKGWA